MRRLPATLLALSLFASAAAHAEKRERLGFGILLTNGAFGDGYDRQRIGSLQTSYLWGTAWQGAVPDQIGDILEKRLGFEPQSPDNLHHRADDGRPYAGSISVGAHTHLQHGAVEMAVGEGLVFKGSDTRLTKLQRAVHVITDDPKPPEETLAHQSGNGVHPSLVVEVGRNFEWGESSTLRSFVEGRAGDETLPRAGFDYTFGSLGRGGLGVRDTATGHHNRTVDNGAEEGVSFLLAADVAHVIDNIYLPEDRGLDLTGSRDRLRAGIHWQGDGASAFYGMTWLGPEFESPSEDQIVGSVRVKFRF